MKQNGFWKGFGSGLVLTVLIAALCVTATATSKRSIQVEDGIGITLNGARFTPRDAAGKQVPVFLYNGTTYVPVRAISEAMGMDVSFNSATRTVQLTPADRTASQQGASSASGNYISADRAKQIALNDAGVKEANAVFLRANLDWDDGRMKYEVEFYSGTTEYDYDIDAVTGAILSSDRELENFQIWNNGTSRPSGNGSNSSSGDYITAERAQQIALAETPSGSTVVKCQFDWDDGRAQYEVEIRNGWTEYEFEIDAVTGAIRSADRDVEGFTVPSTSGGATITADRAKQIALAEVPGGTVFKCQLDRDDGRLVYEVEVYSGTTEYDFEIDAYTGDVLSRDMDSIYD